MQQAPIRIVLAKLGLDGHDRGIKLVMRALRDAGIHVIYTGLFQSPESVAQAVADEDADMVGISILSGAHMTLIPRLIECLKERDASDVPIMIGGVLPDSDIQALMDVGVAAVFGPATPLDRIVRFVQTYGE